MTSVVSSTGNNDDDFQLPKQKSNKKNANNKNVVPRIYIGNLPVGITESSLRKELLSSTTTSSIASSIQIKKNKNNCHAFVTCNNNNKEIDQIISSLHQKQFQGKKLIVQREQQQRKSNNNTNSKRGGGNNKFGNSNTNFGGGWSKPKQPSVPTTPPAVAEEKTDPALVVDENPFLLGGDPNSRMASVIHDEMQAATTNDEILNTTLASLAAVSFLAPAMNDQEGKDETKQQQLGDEIALNDPTKEEKGGEDTTEGGGGFDFMSRCKKPLSELLAEEYGEEDPNWQSVQPTDPLRSPEDTATTELSPPIETTTAVVAVENPQQQPPAPTENRLGRQGKAPIHVEFVSFGYNHGAPSAIRNGWSHAQPLPVLDVCRENDDDDDDDNKNWCLPPVPGHLIWRDGTSGLIQRIVLGTNPQLRDQTKSFAQDVLDALRHAIDDGQHGYVSPIQIKIYVGSESGRHRSVVVCEQTAKQLRNLLRQNINNTITVPVSVGTFHRDLEQRKQQGGSNNKNRKKNKNDDDDDW